MCDGFELEKSIVLFVESISEAEYLTASELPVRDWLMEILLIY